MTLEKASEIIVNMHMKPDELYALLVKLFNISPTIYIVSGNESTLKMQLIKLSDDKTDYHFNIRITFNGELSRIHFNASDEQSESKLGDAVTVTTQAFVSFYSLMQKRKYYGDKDGSSKPI